MSAPQLDLYFFEECPYCQRVLKVIQRLNIKVNLCNTRENKKLREKLQLDTGVTQVPCLYIDQKPMFESADIIQWLEANSAQLEKAL